MILGVDALNLEADRRGMGRYVRSVLRGLKTIKDVEVRLIFRNMLRDLRKTDVDVLWYPWNGIRFTLPVPKIVSIYDAFAFTFPARNIVARLRERRPIRRAVRMADEVTTISNWSAAQLYAQLGIAREKITILPPIIDSFWRVDPDAERGDFILFVAAPEERKNARFLFGAFEQAFGDGSVELRVAGKLSVRDATAFEKLRARKSRVVAGDAELRTLYGSSLAVAIPSLAEGYGIVALEAMACGAPVIAANATALPEACDGAALLVAPDDRTEWIEAMRRIARDRPLRETLRAAGFARVARIDPLAPAKGIANLARAHV
ncbi:MAG TPA: glycosyltransferase family 1 protein, partial [Candidatus Rubrimentiphilum sp.]|nr:glycosyltransferase family 1 protein [Candidatus Rubrimentiphilum sp.]